MNIVSSSLATLIALSLISDEGVATMVSTVVMTIIVFMFGEIIPKNIAKANADKLAQILSYPLAVIYVIIYPIMQILISFCGYLKKFLEQRKCQYFN